MEMFDTQDVNKDDKLSGDEIPDHMRHRLDFVDTDGDGEVSREEMEAMAERFRGGPPGGPGGRGGPGRGGPSNRGPGEGRRGDGRPGGGGDAESNRPQRPN